MDYQALKQKESEARALADSYGAQAEEAQARAVKKGGMKAWEGYTFESSSTRTPEFAQFARAFRAFVKKSIGTGYTLEEFNTGHFYVSGFVKNNATGKYAYFSISDVRHFPGEWSRSVLVRTAQHAKDYTGGANDFASLDRLAEKIERITA